MEKTDSNLMSCYFYKEMEWAREDQGLWNWQRKLALKTKIAQGLTDNAELGFKFEKFSLRGNIFHWWHTIFKCLFKTGNQDSSKANCFSYNHYILSW